MTTTESIAGSAIAEERSAGVMETKLKAKNWIEAKTEMVEMSKANPGKYLIPIACFGCAYAQVSHRLHVFSPSDAAQDWYVLNGEVKQFTTAQRIADQNATPILS